MTPIDEEKGGPEALYFKETAGQTFGVGDLVYLDSNGTVAICTVSSFNLSSAILGIAQQAATGVTGANVRVRLITQQDRFLMNLFHTTAASAVFAQTNLGTPAVYPIRMNAAALPTGTTGKWVVDLVTTAEGTGVALGKVKIIAPLLAPDAAILATTGQYAQPAIGDLYAPVIVQFIPVTIATDGAAHTFNLQGA